MTEPTPTDHHENLAPQPATLLSLRSLALTTTSSITGLTVGALTWYASSGDLAAGMLAGIASGGLALDRLHRWTGT